MEKPSRGLATSATTRTLVVKLKPNALYTVGIHNLGPRGRAGGKRDMRVIPTYHSFCILARWGDGDEGFWRRRRRKRIYSYSANSKARPGAVRHRLLTHHLYQLVGSVEFVFIPLSPPVGVPDRGLVLCERAGRVRWWCREGRRWKRLRERETLREKDRSGELFDWRRWVRGREGQRQRQAKRQRQRQRQQRMRTDRTAGTRTGGKSM